MFKWRTEHLPNDGMTGEELVELFAFMLVESIKAHERKYHAGQTRP